MLQRRLRLRLRAGCETQPELVLDAALAHGVAEAQDGTCFLHLYARCEHCCKKCCDDVV